MSGQSAFDLAASRAYLVSRQERAYQVAEQLRQAALHAVYRAARLVLPRFPDVERAYVFGSVLRPGAMHAGSDIDIALEGRLSAEEYFALWQALESELSEWTVDLVELDQEVRFADRVRGQGALIYERSDSDVESRNCCRPEGDH
ncbi:MAG: nucleotidyltransferase domain-containing protein [Chloroflexi bacterium]|nr:nucleotidyltransferase domain-containing protein [Chloroflexota bacterium]